MRWVIRGISILVSLLALALAIYLIPPHLQIRGVTPGLPSDSELRNLLSLPDGPTRILLVRSSEQSRPGFAIGHMAVAIEWSDGRMFVIDAAMDHQATLDFAELIALMGPGAGPVQFHGTIADRLGGATSRIAGLGFTHLHIDHVQGIGALCNARGPGATVYRTRWQADEHNLHTREGSALVDGSCFAPTTLDGEGLLAVEGFPGLMIAGLGGHTPGSTLFVAAVDGMLWLMSGDISNAKDDLLNNRGKGFAYSGLIVPENTRRTEELRLWLARLDAEPDMQVIVSHDIPAALASGLPDFNEDATP